MVREETSMLMTECCYFSSLKLENVSHFLTYVLVRTVSGLMRRKLQYTWYCSWLCAQRTASGSNTNLVYFFLE
jgi:hypothetical protein